jgi:hypothetical protein
MRTRIVEAVQGPDGPNHGKFLVGRFDEEWQRTLQIPGVEGDYGLLANQGWRRSHVLVVDLATGEGAIFYPNPSGSPHVDLTKHRIWVCPLFEAFLSWLYQRGPEIHLESLPAVVHLDAPFAFQGYRRPGPTEQFMATWRETMQALRDND